MYCLRFCLKFIDYLSVYLFEIIEANTWNYLHITLNIFNNNYTGKNSVRKYALHICVIRKQLNR